MVMLTVGRWRVGSTLTEDALPSPLFLSRYGMVGMAHSMTRDGCCVHQVLEGGGEGNGYHVIRDFSTLDRLLFALL